MPQVRLPFIPSGFLNNANSPTSTGLAEPITGAALSSGLTPGAYFDLTDAEAKALSNPAVGTLFGGRYMWVQLDPAAVIAGNGALQRGQGLFWSLDVNQPYKVTNVPPVGASRLAGVFLNTAPGGAFPVTPGQWFFMQVISAGRATVKMQAAVTAAGLVVGAAVYTTLAGGVDAGLFDANTIATLADATSHITRYAGVAETAPANGSLTVVEIHKAGPAVL